jgi:hypothetical protein
VTGTLIFGRADGETPTATVTPSITGHVPYVCAVLPPAPEHDDAWLERWRGSSRAVRQHDGTCVVYWQINDPFASVDGVLDELRTLCSRDETPPAGS